MAKKFWGLGLQDPEVVGEVQGAKIWWRWYNHKQEPWAKIWHLKYARGWPTSQLVRFCREAQGSHIWQKAREGLRLIQEQSFWEIQSRNLANIWDDSWNQLPKLGADPKWQHIRIICLEEGK